MKSVIPAAALVVLGCNMNMLAGPPQKVAGNWSSPLENDLRKALANANSTFAQKGWNLQIRWAAVKQTVYEIGRGPTGVPISEVAEMMFVYSVPAAPGKCFIQPAGWNQLVRQNVGGDSYGPPYLNVPLQPVRPNGSATGSEIPCAELDKAQGGIFVGVNDAMPTQPTDPSAGHIVGH
jgi:hypothetical protein